MLQPQLQRQQLKLVRLLLQQPTAATSATNAATSETNAASSATAAANSALKLQASANFEILKDTTPQLGGNLDTNEKEIVTVSNRDLVLAANGTGAVEIKGNTNSGKLLFNCNRTDHVSLQAAANSAFAGNVAFTLPTNTGSNIQALVTNGSGVLSFANSSKTKPTVADVSVNNSTSNSYNNKYYWNKFCFNTYSTIYKWLNWSNNDLQTL